MWEMYLPLVEYAYNNTIHTSTRKSPFKVIEGCTKIPLILRTNEKIFVANEYVQDVKDTFQRIKEALQRAQEKQKQATDKHRR